MPSFNTAAVAATGVAHLFADVSVMHSLIVLFILFTANKAYRWYTRSTDAAEVINEFDNDGCEKHTTRFQRELAYEFKSIYGDLRDNKANRIIAGDWVRKTMLERDVRYRDIAMLYPMTVELCLVPSLAALGATAFARSAEARARRTAADMPQ